MPASLSPTASVVAVTTPSRVRKLDDVPYVEVYGGRVQGVVSSSSDVERVYVSYFQADGFSCATNNNRPCGGLRGSPCKHLYKMLEEALVQLGAERVVRGLGLACDPETIKRAPDVVRHLRGGALKAETGVVFARFLSYLRFLEIPASSEPAPELAWFVAG